MKVVHIPCLDDNYAYLLIDTNNKVAAAVDPVEPEKIKAAATAEGVSISTILTTHHHSDHAGGNAQLSEELGSSVPVVGGDDRIPAMTKKVGEGDVVDVGSLKVHCMFTPCHTTGHICYFVPPTDNTSAPVVFTGDTLFVGGCGRFFEGTGEQMYSALVEKLGHLPPATKCYCGHEYAVANLKYALSVDPENTRLKEKHEWAKQQREKGLPAIPSTIDEELQVNPFMRVDNPTIKANVGDVNDSGATTMGKLRESKNSFKDY